MYTVDIFCVFFAVAWKKQPRGICQRCVVLHVHE
jgi:hypothetical protein